MIDTDWCAQLAREFMLRIEPWAGKQNATVTWVTRAPFVSRKTGATYETSATPVREGVTIGASWCSAYGRDPRLHAHVEEDCSSKPHGSGWEAMRARDQWRHDTHMLRMPEVLSPWAPLLEMWDQGAMIDKLSDTECHLIEYTR